MAAREYTALQIPKNSKAHKQLRTMAKQLGKKLSAEAGVEVKVEHYKALEWCVSLGLEKLREED
tara:strand:- start:43 stop:234 length:192 start_codon:yes stop_codon:yes gene_type:complete